MKVSGSWTLLNFADRGHLCGAREHSLAIPPQCSESTGEMMKTLPDRPANHSNEPEERLSVIEACILFARLSDEEQKEALAKMRAMMKKEKA